MIQSFRNIFLRNKFLFRLIFFLLADAVLIVLSVALAFVVRFEGQIPDKYDLNVLGVTALALLITIPVFYFSDDETYDSSDNEIEYSYNYKCNNININWTIKCKCNSTARI